MIKYVQFMLLATFIYWGSPVFSCLAESFEPWSGAVDLHTKIGNERTIGSIDVMIPLQQDENNMLFLDTRGIFTNQDTSEGNIGLGYRCKNCISKNWIFGSYGFFDRRRSQHDKYFSQLTMGVEVLSDTWDFRINGYQPISEKKLISQAAATAELTPNGTVFVDSGETFEKSLRGYDIEFGRKLDDKGNTWAHAAFYKFGGWGNPNVDGIRVRIHSDITDWLRIGAETMYDGPRGHNTFAELRVRIPFGAKPKEKSLLQKRFYEPIVRDIDIVTQSIKAAKEPAKGSNGSNLKIIFVDNSVAVGGDGTQATPYNTLAAAESAEKRSETIYVLEGDGTVANMNAGITINSDNIRFVGEGVALTTLEGVVILPSGNAPKITNTAGDAITVSANNIEVAGFTIDAPTGDGVYILDNNYLNVHDLTINNAGLSGVHAVFSKQTRTLTVEDVAVTGSTQNGIKLETYLSGNMNVTLRNNTLTNNTQPGVFIQSNNQSLLNLTLDTNTSTGNGGNGGFYVQGATDATMIIDATNNTATNNNNYGMYYISGGEGSTTLTSSGNTVTGNINNGISVWAQDSSTLTASFLNEDTSTNTTGFTVTANSSAQLDIAMGNINSSNNTVNGFLVRNQNSAQLLMGIENSTIASNGNNGFDIENTSGDTMEVDLGGGDRSSTGSNSIYSNTVVDMKLNTGSQLSATQNWWGNVLGLQPAQTNLIGGSTIDSSSFLTSDPN